MKLIERVLGLVPGVDRLLSLPAKAQKALMLGVATVALLLALAVLL